MERAKSPSGQKMESHEINRIKQQAIEAEQRYKKRIKAVVKIQRFWRKMRKVARQKRIRWKTLKAQGTSKSEHFPQAEKWVVQPESFVNLLYKTQRNDLDQTNLRKRFEGSLICFMSNKQKEKLKAFYYGWKTRKILKNEHLRDLKSEIWIMIKLNLDRTDKKESKIIKAEFARISRKFWDIFDRLWITNDWIKRNHIPKNLISRRKSPNRVLNVPEINQ